MTVGLAVPVLNNFKGYTKLMMSVDTTVMPFVQPNWEENIGVGPAWNNALNWGRDKSLEYLIIVNDDVIFRPGVINKMLHWSARGYDLVSPQNETGVCHPYGLNFWCFMVKPAEFLRKFGTFDENFAPAYYEDDDMAYRIKLAGGSIKNLNEKAYHEVMGTKIDQDTHRSYYENNLEYYIEKWGGEPSMERYDNPYGDPTKDHRYWRN